MMEVLPFDPANRNRFAAAYSYRFEDLHLSASSKFTEQFAFFATELAFLESTDDRRIVLWADMSSVVAGVKVRNYAAQDIGAFLIEPVDVEITVYAQTLAEVTAKEPPNTGLAMKFRIYSSGAPISYEIGLYPDSLGALVINKDELYQPTIGTKGSKEAVHDSEEFFLGAQRISGTLSVTPIDANPDILEWLTSNFPEYESSILTTLFADVRLIQDVSKTVVPNVQLIGKVEYFWEMLPDQTSQIVFGSEQAKLLAPDCPVNYSQAVIEAADIQAAKNSITVVGDEVRMDAINITHKTLVKDYTRAEQPPQRALPHFSIWMNKSILNTTFDWRLGKNLGAMLGAHYSDRKGPIKYWLSGAWILEGVQGSLEIKLDPNDIAALALRFDGRTKFDALSYIDIGCFTYELGSFDGFHEQFDFSLYSRVYYSNEGKLIFVGGIQDVTLAGWKSFIRFFFDRFNTSWAGLVVEFVGKFIVGQYIRMLVEGEISKAMGSLSLDLLDVKKIPIFGDLIAPYVDGQKPANLQAISRGYEKGIEISIGANG